MWNDRDLSIEQSNRDYHFCHNWAAKASVRLCRQLVNVNCNSGWRVSFLEQESFYKENDSLVLFFYIPSWHSSFYSTVLISLFPAAWCSLHLSLFHLGLTVLEVLQNTQNNQFLPSGSQSSLRRSFCFVFFFSSSLACFVLFFSSCLVLSQLSSWSVLKALTSPPRCSLLTCLSSLSNSEESALITDLCRM